MLIFLDRVLKSEGKSVYFKKEKKKEFSFIGCERGVIDFSFAYDMFSLRM